MITKILVITLLFMTILIELQIMMLIRTDQKLAGVVENILLSTGYAIN